MKGIIEGFTNGKITLTDDSGDSIVISYISNGNFNHSYIGETVELVIDENGVAVDCINKRHRS